MVADQGGSYKNMIAGHLLKAVHLWTDLGLGEFELFFLRTKDKREVDFLVVRDSKPWFLVEVKSSDTKLSRHLGNFLFRFSKVHGKVYFSFNIGNELCCYLGI